MFSASPAKPSSIRKSTSKRFSAPSRTATSRWPAGSPARSAPITATRTPPRSEEHTSELQSQFPLVCRLLLEKRRPPPRATLFPYTTLFRSHHRGRRRHGGLLGARPDQPQSLPPARHRDLFLLRRRRHHAHAGTDHRSGARRLRGASARRSARIRERPAAHAAVPRALRLRHGLAPRHLARPPRLDAKRRRRRLLQEASSPRLSVLSRMANGE